MIHKIRAIVLHHLNYGDTSIIAHLYTDKFGRQSVMIKGARGQRKNRKISLYHPLALLEIELYYKENRDLQQIREARPIVPLQGLMVDPLKNTVALFLAEVFYRTMRESEPNPELFDYLSSSIQYYDLMEDGISLFHLHIMAHLTRFLGFKPNLNRQDENDWFDLYTGSFSSSSPIHNYRLEPGLSNKLHQILTSSLDQIQHINIGRNERTLLIEKLIDYYQLHLDGMGEIKSYPVLKTVFQ
jgi:DNA repair protein RecO (recombination protein O)